LVIGAVATKLVGVEGENRAVLSVEQLQRLYVRTAMSEPIHRAINRGWGTRLRAGVGIVLL
jgi:hypothetical protein